MKATVYMLVDPFTHEPKYVGRTIYPLKRRLYGHLYHIQSKPLRQWIKSLLIDGYKPLIVSLEASDNPQDEAKWIRMLLLSGHSLLNESPDGKGARR